MVNPTGLEVLTVQGVYNNAPAATTETFNLNQIAQVPALFGGGTATMEESGNVDVELFPINSAASYPAGITNDYVIAAFNIPAGSFSTQGKGVDVTATGSFSNNSHTKTCKLIFNPTAAVPGSIISGGTTIATTGAVTNPNVGWFLESQIFKYGAAGSNTQLAQEMSTIVGTTHGGCGTPSAITANESASILIAVTGNAATSQTDIQLSTFYTAGMN